MRTCWQAVAHMGERASLSRMMLGGAWTVSCAVQQREPINVASRFGPKCKNVIVHCGNSCMVRVSAMMRDEGYAGTEGF
jgi:hypothetical protein